MRYGAIEVLASNSVHGNLLAHIVRVPMQSGNFIGMARLPVRSRTSPYSKKPFSSAAMKVLKQPG
jgi:hypothetical protein